MEMTELSACLIVRNEEKLLDECLLSLEPMVQEICVVDTGSTDRTVDIARDRGARVEHFEWCDDFSAARNASIEMASKPWILVIDADERLSEASLPHLKRAIAEPTAIAWLIYQDNLSADGSVHSLAVPRLFRNRPEIRFQRPVHESIMESLFDLGVTELAIAKVHVTHHGYLPDVLADNDKHVRNLEILERRAAQKPDDLFTAYKLAITLKHSARSAEAAVAFEHAFRLAEQLDPQQRSELPFAPLIYAGEAENLILAGKLSRARSILDPAISAFPGDTDLLYLHGEWARRVGDLETARARFGACLRGPSTLPIHASNPFLKGVAPLLGLAHAAMDEGDVERAAASLDKCRRSAPNNLTARCLSTRLMFAIGETETASRALTQLVEAAANSKEVQLLAGEVGWIQGDRHLAREMWEIAQANTARRDLFVADASNLAVAWLIAADLADGEIDTAAGRLPLLVARDLQTAGCRLLASIVSKQDPQIEEAFPVARVVAHLESWSDEISIADQPRLLAAFNSNASQYAERFVGIKQLFIENSEV